MTNLTPPNIIVILADDMGYGDLACYGSETIATPNLDRLASEGLRFTDFYAAAPFCSPSRASLLTGRYPIRAGVPLVLFPTEKTGLPADEVTIADVLGDRAYATACIGKWHLGMEAPFHPLAHGFDEYFGLPYSNDMMLWDPTEPFRAQHALEALPLLENADVVEAPVEQTSLTQRYTERAVDFIERQADGPFFLYLAHTFPHSPQYASQAFDGRSKGGIYGDTVEEIDHSTGCIIAALRRLGLAENTLVFFTSDNGPAPGNPNRIVDGKPRYSGGSAGPLRGRKGLTWEGGMREPAIAWWPGTIASGRVTDRQTSTLDLMPTLTALAGANVPGDRTLDGTDISSLLLDGDPASTDGGLFCYYFGCQLQAVRRGPWKLILPIDEYPDRDDAQSLWYLLSPGLLERQHRLHPGVELYNLVDDIGETTDVAAEHPNVVSQLLAEARDFDRALQADRQSQVWLGPLRVPPEVTAAR